MSRKKIFLAAGILLLLSIIGLILWRTLLRPPSFSSLRGEKDFNVVLVTVDTLRADRIGCYGFKRIETPTMDLFADLGIRFERCIAQTPLTLPSHTSILTGTLPLFHGVRDNGGFVVPPELETMAEVFKGRGYETAAFVGAYVLDSKWGLDQGFDYYFDKFDLSKFEKISLGTVQRPGNEVMDEALSWLEGKKDKKFFVWIHLYDPHTPYEPPSPFDSRYPSQPYLGEIAFTDTQLARLWEFLESRNLRANSFLIFAADHGESLGEHEEGTHGFFVYQEGIHVPLIFVTPFENLQGITCSQIVSLTDIMPTALEMAGFPVPAQVQGESLIAVFFKPELERERYAYAETFYPRFHYGWSELKTIQNRKYKLVISPDSELYDLTVDPEEQTNLRAKEPKVFAEMMKDSDRFIEEGSRNAYEFDIQKIDEETRQKLQALGYIGSFTDTKKLEGRQLANPKEKIIVFNDLTRAREMGLQGQVDVAVAIIEEIIKEDPDITNAYFSLGNILVQGRRYKEAIANFEIVLDKKPDDTFAAMNIAFAYQRMGDLESAEKFVLEYLEKGFFDPQFYFILGGIKFLQQKYDESISYYEQCLGENPESTASHNALGAIYIAKKEFDKAEPHIRTALSMNPKLHNVYFNLAQVLEERGDVDGAIEAYEKELANSPKSFRTSFNLSRLYRISGRVEEELKYLKMTMDSNPDFPLAYFYLARIYLNRQENLEEAISLVKKGIELKPEEKDLPLGYFLLADLYNRLGNNSLSSEYAQKGQEIVRNNRNNKD